MPHSAMSDFRRIGRNRGRIARLLQSRRRGEAFDQSAGHHPHSFCVWHKTHRGSQRQETPRLYRIKRSCHSRVP